MGRLWETLYHDFVPMNGLKIKKNNNNLGMRNVRELAIGQIRMFMHETFIYVGPIYNDTI